MEIINTKGYWQNRLYNLPKGFIVKPNVKYSKEFKRYMWNPKPKDLFWQPATKMLFQYIKWGRIPDKQDQDKDAVYGMSLDGWAKIKILSSGDPKYKPGQVSWTGNMWVRNQIPVIKKK